MKNWIVNYFSNLDVKLKSIFAIVGVVVLAEIVWAVFSLTRPLPSPAQNTPKIITPPTEKSTSIAADEASIKLTGPPEYSVGSVAKLDIHITSSEPTDGADIIIKYDPKALEVVPAAGAAQADAVAVGKLYKDYPTNEFDEEKGLIFVSGLTPPNAKGFSGQGVFGSVSFKVLKSGASRVDIEFSPDSTKDSNIISTKTGKDILTAVAGLNIVAK